MPAHRVPWTAGAIAMLLAATIATPARAEWFVELSGGGAFNDATPLTVSDVVPFPLDTSWSVTREPRFDPAGVIALGLGEWSARSAFGWSADVSFLEAQAEGVEVTMIPVAMMVMARRSMGSGRRGTGPMDLYVGGGLAVGPSRVRVDWRPEAPKAFDEWAAAGGLAARAGIALRSAGRLTWLAEYRFTLIDLGARWHWASTTLRSHQARVGMRLALKE